MMQMAWEEHYKKFLDSAQFREGRIEENKEGKGREGRREGRRKGEFESCLASSVRILSSLIHFQLL